MVGQELGRGYSRTQSLAPLSDAPPPNPPWKPSPGTWSPLAKCPQGCSHCPQVVRLLNCWLSPVRLVEGEATVTEVPGGGGYEWGVGGLVWEPRARPEVLGCRGSGVGVAPLGALNAAWDGLGAVERPRN